MDGVLTKPVVAAIHGTALGGGLEVALGCNYRVAIPSARLGLPEVALGLLPGAGGTQRLPRVVGVENALEMITSGRHVPAKEAAAMGLVDELVEEGPLLKGALAFAHKLIAENPPVRSVRNMNEKVEAARGHPEIFEKFRRANVRKFRGFIAPEHNIRCIEAAVNLPFDEGLAEEKRLFAELIAGPQSAAQRYYFFSERAANKIPDVPADTPLRPIKKVGVLGAGTMGGGIAMNFVNVSIPVVLVEVKQEALDRGFSVIRKNYEISASRGRITTKQVEQRMALISGSLDMAEAFKDVDLVVEAVFEDMDVKKEVFKKLDAICKPGAILASNTSYLDLDEIATATKRPQDVIGMHFFSPANVMKLLEIVRGAKTAKDILATIMKLGKTIHKVPVVAGVCHGFIGNRMLSKHRQQTNAVMMRGAKVADVDRVFTDFGFAVGPFQMGDIVGLDVIKDKPGEPLSLRGTMVVAGRLGQKNGKGFYDYDDKRNRTPSPEAEAIIEKYRQSLGVTSRAFSEEEILEFSLNSVVNEGAKILEEGLALRPSDIDVVWVNGYNWPVYRGGPMYWADQQSLDNIVAKLKKMQVESGDEFKPSPLLEKLAAEGKKFSDWKPG